MVFFYEFLLVEFFDGYKMVISLRDRALSVFRAAISDKFTVQQAIEKVQKEALVEVEERFKGQRFKVALKLDFFYLTWTYCRVSSSLTTTQVLSPST